MKAPRIGVNCDLVVEKGGGEKLALNWAYAEGVLRAGGLPILLAPVEADALLAEQLDGLDGLLLTGGDDYDPALYGQERHEATELLHPRRSDYDVRLARAAVARGLPVLGICGGAQLLNIALGGTLLQDVPSQWPGAHRHSRTLGSRPTHAVSVEPGSRLAGIVGAGEVETNSSHHQALDAVAPGLRVVARAPDGIIEAVEGTGRGFLLAVQWHPERLLDRPLHLALFEALIEAARRL
jgi:putative glutamine amidotransferase